MRALIPMSVAVSDTIFWLAVALCAVAQLFILKAVFSPAPLPMGGPAEAGRAAGRLRPASRPLELIWVVLPAVGLVFLFLWAWQLKHAASDARVSMASAVAVAVTAAPDAP